MWPTYTSTFRLWWLVILPYSRKRFREKIFVNWWKIPFPQRKLSRIARFCHAKGHHPPNFAEKTSVNSHKITKFAKVSPSKSFLLYGMLCVTCLNSFWCLITVWLTLMTLLNLFYCNNCYWSCQQFGWVAPLSCMFMLEDERWYISDCRLTPRGWRRLYQRSWRP